MPMRWTPENDQLLLVKIIEVCAVNPDVRTIAELWPNKEGEDRPTPRAISERLVKIRNLIRANGGDMQISGRNKKSGAGGGTTKSNATSNGTGATRKPRAPKKKKEPGLDSPTVKLETETTTNNGAFNALSAHLGENAASDEESPEATQEPLTPPASIKRKRSVGVDLEDEDSLDFGLGSKKVKTEPLGFGGAGMGMGIYDGVYEA